MVSLLCNPSRREANTHCQKIQASAQVWQAVLLPMSLWSHTADSLSPRLRTDCPLWFELSMQPWYMLGLCGVFFTHTHTHTHFLEGSAGGAWKLPNGRIFTRWRGAPLSSPPPLTSTATWPKAMRMPLKKALDLLYHPLFTNNYSRLSHRNKAVLLCGQPFWLCWHKILLKSVGKL